MRNIPASVPPSRERKVVKTKPFTVEHFVQWAAHLILDSGEKWLPEQFQLAFVEDVFAGYPECWLVVPEGNGKTTLVAGLALYFCEFSPQLIVISTAGEPGGEFELARERIRQTATEIKREKCFVRAASQEIVLHEWAVPETGDVEDLELVASANPFSRVTVGTLASKRRAP